LRFLRFDDGDEEDDERYTLVEDGVEEDEEEEAGDDDERGDGREADVIGPAERVSLGGVAGAAFFSSCFSLFSASSSRCALVGAFVWATAAADGSSR
jgi:hypothetical protein